MNRLNGVRRSFASAALIAIAASMLCMTSILAAAQQETVLYSFGTTPDGRYPAANMVVDSAGNLYGMTAQGGDYSYGTVFELTPNSSGGWTETILHSFNPNNTKDGASPVGGLVIDASGNLYGTTYLSSGPYGGGAVIEMVAQAGGGWKEKILHAFAMNSPGGQNPESSLILDAGGNLYGTTTVGGSTNCAPVGCGTVFELVRSAGGGWTEKVLHTFTNDGTDGYGPLAGVVFDTAGNLYGTTTRGGNVTTCGGGVGCGTVFELSPANGGIWTEKILHNFSNNGTDGYDPLNGVVVDAKGSVYGTTQSGGLHGDGMAFELTPLAGGTWEETILHNFRITFNGSEGIYPNALTIDSAGNLYSTTRAGGLYGAGTVFKLTNTAGRVWTETILFNFDGANGEFSNAGLVFDAHGNMYGTTQYGGAGTYSNGIVFEITP
jgi:uncharacterized repeat protein (TIGR03803 family)